MDTTVGRRPHRSKMDSEPLIKSEDKSGGKSARGEEEVTDANPDVREKCCFQGRFFCDALKAIVSRQLFLFHALLAIWRLTVVSGNDMYWLLTMSFIPVAIETSIILFHRRGQEWKWFQPSVFLYLLSTLPPIWLLELKNLGFINFQGPVTGNASSADQFEAFPWIELNQQQWLLALEQILLVLVILNRWIIPKGDLSRDELSSLLLSHLGTASDIVDFFSILSEPDARMKKTFVFVVLFIWSLSLAQFSIVSTAKREIQLDEEEEDADDDANDVTHRSKKVQLDDCAVAVPIALGSEVADRKKKFEEGLLYRLKIVVLIFLETEAWSIMFSLMMQDAPFLIIRLVTILGFHWLTYTNCFFAAKNFLFLLLQFYRIYSLYIEQKARRDEKVKAKKDMWLVKVQFLDYPDPEKWKKDRNTVYDTKYFKF